MSYLINLFKDVEFPVYAVAEIDKFTTLHAFEMIVKKRHTVSPLFNGTLDKNKRFVVRKMDTNYLLYYYFIILK